MTGWTWKPFWTEHRALMRRAVHFTGGVFGGK
jgi:hypothetical protein